MSGRPPPRPFCFPCATARLATDIFKPAGDGPFPVVLSRTPYDRTKHAPGRESFVRDGFVLVSQDMRGPLRLPGRRPAVRRLRLGRTPGRRTRSPWLRKQPWCDGSVGAIGGSAGGITQNLLAGAAPQGLKAQVISVAAANTARDATYIGGAFRKADMENWLTGNKFDPQALEIMRAHPCATTATGRRSTRRRNSPR